MRPFRFYVQPRALSLDTEITLQNYTQTHTTRQHTAHASFIIHMLAVSKPADKVTLLLCVCAFHVPGAANLVKSGYAPTHDTQTGSQRACVCEQAER